MRVDYGFVLAFAARQLHVAVFLAHAYAEFPECVYGVAQWARVAEHERRERHDVVLLCIRKPMLRETSRDVCKYKKSMSE
jgi:hypothetical protein